MKTYKLTLLPTGGRDDIDTKTVEADEIDFSRCGAYIFYLNGKMIAAYPATYTIINIIYT